MEAAYGLAITVTMLMTTVLLYFYLHQNKDPFLAPFIVTLFLQRSEGIFFISSATKIFPAVALPSY